MNLSAFGFLGRIFSFFQPKIKNMTSISDTYQRIFVNKMDKIFK
jgi:hypothetical protein